MGYSYPFLLQISVYTISSSTTWWNLEIAKLKTEAILKQQQNVQNDTVNTLLVILLSGYFVLIWKG